MAGIKSCTPSVEVVERWIKSGIGQGQGSSYKPSLYIRDVASMGTSSAVKSFKTGRVHHYLSKQEFKVHLLAEYSSSVLDIREQFALLPWEETQVIARKLGIRHPIYPQTSTPIVMTTDLVLTLAKPTGMETLAVCVKHTKDFSPRTMQKLLIERAYWNVRGIRWILATENTIPNVRASNLSFFEMSLNDEKIRYSHISPLDYSKQFEQNHLSDLSFNQILFRTCSDFGIDVRVGHSLLGTAVWKKISRLDLDRQIITHRSQIHLREN